jgi:DNA-directed RNA polymerase I and III subunit RPAC2
MTRVPTLDNLSSLSALLKALTDMDQLYESIEDAYRASLQGGQYEVWEEKS